MSREINEALINGQDLTFDQARELMESIMDGALAEVRIASILTALRIKGETVDEIAGFASAMREKSVRITPETEGVIDTCGTGGDARHTFNVSTAAALVTAAMGVPVAKHGNRAVSSKCGSADVLEALGINITLQPEQVAALIDRVGIGFLFAPSLHPAMKHAAPVRKELGLRTVFNVLGPLTNPAGVKRQLTGVFSPDLTERLCNVLKTLGSEKVYIVHGSDGTDEVSISGETRVSALENGEVRTFTFTPEEAGLERAPLSAISGSSPEENAGHIRDIVDGKPGPRRDAVLLNAGFAAALADRADGPAEGVDLARQAIDSGAAGELLQSLEDVSNELAS